VSTGKQETENRSQNFYEATGFSLKALEQKYGVRVGWIRKHDLIP
jgi:hypothetical protein